MKEFPVLNGLLRVTWVKELPGLSLVWCIYICKVIFAFDNQIPTLFLVTTNDNCYIPKFHCVFYFSRPENHIIFKKEPMKERETQSEDKK